MLFRVWDLQEVCEKLPLNAEIGLDFADKVIIQIFCDRQRFLLILMIREIILLLNKNFLNHAAA